MRIRPAHLAVAAALLLGTTGAATAAGATTVPVADRPVSRFVAFQACQAGAWRWTAENAAAGTEVSAFRHRYRAQDVWRERGGWHVQIAGKRGQQPTTSNDAAQCLIKGTNAAPRIAEYTWPR